MKNSQPIQPVTERFPALEEQEVEFTFSAPAAHMVEVAGTFNNWHPQTNPLVPTGTGDWTARLMLKSGRYEYRFVVDGFWTDALEDPLKAANPFGGFNSVLQVGLDDRTDLL